MPTRWHTLVSSRPCREAKCNSHAIRLRAGATKVSMPAGEQDRFDPMG
jgi:hypothetical protein